MLSNEDIKKSIRKGEITITPRVKPDQITQASVDLRLSDEFFIQKSNLFGSIVEANDVNYTDLYELRKADTILLKPGDMILAKTIEQVKLSNSIIGFMDGRSRFARIGLAVHVTSSIIQPGSSNRQVLEIVNLSEFIVRLKKGMRITQVTFTHLESPTTKPYSKFKTIKDK